MMNKFLMQLLYFQFALCARFHFFQRWFILTKLHSTRITFNQWPNHHDLIFYQKVIFYEIELKNITVISFYIKQFHFVTNKFLMQLLYAQFALWLPDFNWPIHMVHMTWILENRWHVKSNNQLLDRVIFGHGSEHRLKAFNDLVWHYYLNLVNNNSRIVLWWFLKSLLSVKYTWKTINVHLNVRNSEPFKVD